MIDRNDIELIAGEYVLGTLELEDRLNVEGKRKTDNELDEAITRWEQKLMPLNTLVTAVEPDSSVLAKLDSRLDDYLASSQNKTESVIEEKADSISLSQRYKKLADRWRLMALASSLVAACLAMVLVFKPPVPQAIPQEYLAVFQENDQQPAFLMTIDLATQALSIVPVTAQVKPNKAYQLWIVSEDIGPDPQSLGLLDSLQQPTQKLLNEFNAQTLKTATFGISVEPEGGSPTGKPTGAAMHGTLYPFNTELDPK